ncbi:MULTISPECIES: AAA family ATPase [unclassified Bacillus (in: firmicutes)]|uniref:ATP-binding protein n=1 Tax=unclassified Bacillus (in: firmicutes) TaxID=185979 RepID=UPI00111E2F0C|nr:MULTISPECIES: AAA family ATPase [unclassified Bacillus (in: firmicutes)]
MIIKKIHIYGFGKFVDYKQELTSDINVFYGENEAGKSTIFSFIHAMLFGFPAKNQTTASYEPSGSGRYGGKLVIELPEIGEITIERVKGHQGTECGVYNRFGRIGGEEKIKEWLKGVDRNFYESIYSFNLDGLQDIYRLEEDQLGKYLFFAGMSGSERLWEMEAGLQKQMDSLFKPGGKKPILNQKLAELKQSSQAIQKAREKEKSYNTFLSEERELSKEISLTQEQIERIKTNLIHLKDWKRLLPSIQELASIEVRLSELEESPFPVNGMGRMGKIEAERSAKETFLQTQLNKLKVLQNEKDSLQVNEQWLASGERVRQAELYSDKLIILLEEIRTQSIELKHIEDKIIKLQGELHTQFDPVMVESFDTSIFRKEEIKQIELEKHTLAKKKMELDAQLEKERVKLEQIEQITEIYERKLLPENERERLKRIVEQYEHADKAAQEEKSAKEVIQRLKQRRNQALESEKKGKKKQKVILGSVLLASILAVLLLILGGQLGVALIVAVVGIVLVIYINSMNGNQLQSEELAKEINYYEEIVKKSSSISIDEQSYRMQKSMLEEDTANREKYKLESLRKEQQEAIFDSLIDSFEEWEKELALCKHKLITLGNEWSLPNEVSCTMLSDAFERIEQIKNLMLEKSKLISLLAYTEEKKDEYIRYIGKLSEEFGVTGTQSIEQINYSIVQKYKENELVNRQKNNMLEKIQELEEEIIPLKDLCRQLNQEKQQLLQEADCHEVEGFYQRGRDAEERSQLSIAKRQLIGQLGRYANLDQYHSVTDLVLKDRIEEQEAEQSSYESTLNRLRKRLAEVKYEINRLEEDGTVEALLHNHQLLKQEFQVLAKKWTTLSLMKGTLAESITTYKEEKLPAIIEQANGYLRNLTNGRYEKILFSENGEGLSLLDHRGLEVHSKNLSRGTAELTYVSIRLALAGTIDGRKEWPLIMDDTFVNFDDKRTERMISLLKHISKEGNQVLFFTCHDHIAAMFNGQNIIQLTR